MADDEDVDYVMVDVADVDADAGADVDVDVDVGGVDVESDCEIANERHAEVNDDEKSHEPVDVLGLIDDVVNDAAENEVAVLVAHVFDAVTTNYFKN